MKGNRKGFTLVEMLITVALIGILSPLLFSIFVFGIQDYTSTNKYIGQQNKVNEAIRLIRQDYEECKEVVVGMTSVADGAKVIWVKFEFPESYATPAPSATPIPKPKNKVWSFFKDEGTLSLYVGNDDPVTQFDSMAFSPMVKGLKTLPTDPTDFAYSKFEFNSDTLKLYVKPIADNEQYRGRNIKEQIITEFSVRNKYKKNQLVSPLPTATSVPTPVAP